MLTKKTFFCNFYTHWHRNLQFLNCPMNKNMHAVNGQGSVLAASCCPLQTRGIDNHHLEVSTGVGHWRQAAVQVPLFLAIVFMIFMSLLINVMLLPSIETIICVLSSIVVINLSFIVIED